MTRRKQKSVFDEIANAMAAGPVWLGPVIAAAVFFLGWFVLPAVLDNPVDKTQIGHNLAPIAKKAAPYLAGAMLLLWAFARVKRSLTQRTFDRHTNKDSVRQLSWQQFESFVGEAFRRQGYSVEETGDPAGDAGVDLILRKDGQTTLVQCKHWKAFKVGVKLVRELLGVVTDKSAQGAVMVTWGEFTAEAEEFARDNHIQMIDGDELEVLVHSVQGSQSEGSCAKSAFSSANTKDVEASSPPACPQCGRPMVIRAARGGAGAGSKFWGCPAYPRCKGTRPA